ncbi:uncharacterized protein [Clytia hemisphaerica]|uniref:uncharacterized protein n=1 Tax=Clytia hemisphaerica TaxID=252671 RepID=UPI0034D75E73
MAKQTESCVKEFLESLLGGTDFNVKQKQIEAVDSILRGKDTLCVLPTGYGKSLIYQMLPVCFEKFHHIKKPMIIVLSPLLSLISDQVNSAKKLPEVLSLKPTTLDFEKYSEIASGQYNLLIGTPESFLNVKKWRDMLSSETFAERTVCLVVDEVHKVTWGECDKSSKPFREAFKRINELRSVIKENLPILALSATVDVDITKLLKASCSMGQSMNVITEVIDRKNITLHKIKLNQRSSKPLYWVLHGLKDYAEAAPKIVIYCRTVILAGWLYDEFLMSEILPKDILRKHVQIYHSTSFDDEKITILNALKEETDIRVILATSALGCGVDMKSVHFVINFGPAYDTVDFCQQIGRAGRSGTMTMCHAILYSFPRCGRVTQNMRDYMDHQECLRIKLFSE